MVKSKKYLFMELIIKLVVILGLIGIIIYIIYRITKKLNI
jgi:hypothetical protein